MTRVNRDTLVAIFLLLICGVFLVASYEIREPDYGQLSPAAWPRTIIVALTGLCLIYLYQSIRSGPDEPPAVERAPGVAGFLSYWRNVLWVFALFLAYLLTMPFLGMLIGGLLFVFLLLNALGGWSPQLMLRHLLIAAISVGGMWSLFTFGLKVFLPPGEILGRF